MRLQPGEVEPFLDSGEPPIHSVDAMFKTDEVFPHQPYFPPMDRILLLKRTEPHRYLIKRIEHAVELCVDTIKVFAGKTDDVSTMALMIEGKALRGKAMQACIKLG